MRITLGQARDEVAALPNINFAADDDRMVQLINRAQRRLIEESRGQLLHRRIRLTLTDNYVTAPFGVAALTDAAISTETIPLRNEWYEFIDQVCGVFDNQTEYDGVVSLVERGESCLFRDIEGKDKRLRIGMDITQPSGAYVYIQGKDATGTTIRTDPDLTGYISGERIHIAGSGPFYTTNIFSEVTAFKKPATEGAIRLYEYTPSTGAERLIAIYEHNDEVPSFRRYLVRGTSVEQCHAGDTLTAMATLEFIPATDDNDTLVVPSMEAIVTMCEAVNKMQNNDFQSGLGLSREAVRRLAMSRDKYHPRERISVQVTTMPKGSMTNHGIGRIF